MADDDSGPTPTTAAPYLVVFELSPAAMFGVPQPGMTVLSGPGQYEGDVFHRATGRRVGLGAMSQYRLDDEAVSMDFGLLGFSCHLSDNFLHVSVEAHNHGEALATAQRSVGLLTLYMSLLVGRYCGAEPVLIQSGDGDDRTPPPPGTLLSRVTRYNLVELTERIGAAIAATGITDERLLVGMRYLRHAFWLNEQTVTMHDDPENARMLISSCFLHLYKAATAVAGDPTKKDGYQKVTNDLGLGAEFLTVRMKDLRDIRNDYDIAHYSLKPIDNDELNRVFGASVETVTDALAARLALVSKSSAST